jgi:hypothetical protein
VLNNDTELQEQCTTDNSDLSDEAFSSDDENENADDNESSSSPKKTSFTSKLGLTPSRKKSSTAVSSSHRKHDFSNRLEERATMIAKIMFPNLTHLDLSSNRLERLPGSLAYIENLSYLNASSNQNLIRVSPQLGLLTKLWNFDLKNSLNIKEPVMLDSLVKQRTKTSDILGYLKSILEDSRQYSRVKLMFVGVQAIGKTSLLNKLREEGTSTTRYDFFDPT